MDSLIKDLKFASRRLVKSPGFTLIAVLSLALGIGANSAIFSLINTVLLRPLPVEDPERIVSVGVYGKDEAARAFSYPNYVDFRDRNEVLSGIFVHRFAPMSMSRDGKNERLWGYLVTGNYFDVLGIKPARGRLLNHQDDLYKLGHPVAVISYRCWEKRFGADPSVVGKDILLNGRNFSLIGVAPKGFNGTEFIYTPDIWVPMMMTPWIEPGSTWMDNRDSQNTFAIARLKPGIKRETAEASLNLLMAQLGKEYPNENAGMYVRLIPPGFVIGFLRDAIVSFSAVLMATVSLVLLIACTNLAGLLLARATERRKEIAVRLAIGAGRRRLVRQLLTESVLLSLIGGLLGVLLAIWIIDTIVALKLPIEFPLTFDLVMDWRVLLFSIGASVITGLIFGLIPAIQATKPELVPALKDETRTGGYRRSKLRSGLVIVQLSLSLVLLIAAGLVLRTLQQVQTLNPGFKLENGLLMSLDVGLQGYDQDRGEQFYHLLVERLKSLPGIEEVSFTDWFPLSLNFSSEGISVEGRKAERGGNIPLSYVASVGLDYQKAIGSSIVAGRDFSVTDTKDSTKVIVVNEAFARKFFNGEKTVAGAIGKRISINGENGPFLEITGVARDGKYFSIYEPPSPFMYLPMSQSYSANRTVVIRTKSRPDLMVGAIRGEIGKLDPNLPVYDVKTMEEHMGLSLFPARIAGALLGAFGLLALILAAIGIYGVMSYAVAQRTKEIGIRMALGADRGNVVMMVLKQGVILAGIGLAIGVTVSLLLTRMMSSVLYGISATDALTFTGVSTFLIVTVMVAVFIPAYRAARVDPLRALRYE